MSQVGGVELAAVRRDDLPEVGAFLHANLNPRLSPARWAWSIIPTWEAFSSDHGALLRHAGEIVGVQLAFHSRREIDGGPEEFCNLGAFCVVERFREEGIRMRTELLNQQDCTFTDFSPDANVVELNRRLAFQDLDTTSVVVPNVPFAHLRAPRIFTDHEVVHDLLDGAEQRIFDDHRRATASLHVVMVRGEECCYVVLRRNRRQGLPFASVLHTSSPSLLRRWFPDLAAQLLLREHLPYTVVELKHLDGVLPVGAVVRKSQPKMFRSTRLKAQAIDDLYSELTLVAS